LIEWFRCSSKAILEALSSRDWSYGDLYVHIRFCRVVNTAIDAPDAGQSRLSYYYCPKAISQASATMLCRTRSAVVVSLLGLCKFAVLQFCFAPERSKSCAASAVGDGWWSDSWTLSQSNPHVARVSWTSPLHTRLDYYYI